MEQFKYNKGLIIRSFISIVLFMFILINTFFEVGVTQEEPSGIEDKLHNQIKPINEFFRENENFRNFLMIFNNLILDLSIIFLMIIWLSLVKNFKIMISLAIFYIIKIFTQSVFLVRPPKNNLISYPGFPSIFYPYNKNDFFFFSGTVGFYIILINEFYENKNKIKLSLIFLWVNFINLILFIFISLSTYSLFTVDILIGLVTSHYSIRLSRFIYEYNLSKGNIDTEEIEEKDFFEDYFNFLKIPDVNEKEKEKILESNLPDGKRDDIINAYNKNENDISKEDNSIYTH
jgi:hypothetical protein